MGMLGLKTLIEVDVTHGGKATGLRRLIEMGLRVPEGIVLDSASVSGLLDGDPALRAQLDSWLASMDGRLAIRSSAVNEDGAEQSFAGVYESMLKVEPSLDTVLENIRRVSISGRSDRVLSYSGKSFDTIPVVIQKLVDATVSGVLFTKAIDPSGADCAYIEWVWGLGDALVSGKVTPATVRVPWSAETGRLERNRIQITRAVPDPSSVEEWIHLIEVVNRGSSHAGWDVEWAVDAENRLWALQMRPATTEVLVPEVRGANGPLPASPGIANGYVRFVDDTNHGELEDGEVLVAKITEVDYIPAMKRAAAIVTEEGGLLSHAAIVAREFGKPCVVGAVGAQSLLANLQPAEVNGTVGTVRQGDRVLGGDATTEIDWTYLYLYDRGFEFAVDDTLVYIEPTMGGVVAHIDEGTTVDEQRRIDAKIRRTYHTVPNIVKSDRRIWYREWRRFNQLRTVTFVESLFKAAIASWDRRELQHAITALKQLVLEVRRQSPATQMEQLFWKEIGAALHALVWVEVEGHALWSAYRDSATWRARHHVRFTEFVCGDRTANTAKPDPDLVAVLDCMEMLAVLRNEVYPFFFENGVFDDEYFGSRENLVRRACIECGKLFDGEDSSLRELYQNERFRDLDRRFSREAYAIIASASP